MTIENIHISKYQKLSTKEKIAAARAAIKAKGLIHNPILGFATPKEINQCVKDKIITFRSGTYCIPMEQKIVRSGNSVSKEWVVAKRFIDYMVKTGRMKDDAIR